MSKSNAVSSLRIDLINSRPFSVSDRMIAYVTKQHPETVEKFEKYFHEFIGRQGLGPEYD